MNPPIILLSTYGLILQGWMDILDGDGNAAECTQGAGTMISIQPRFFSRKLKGTEEARF